jgi:type I restriction enzyme S subunit
VRVIEILVNDNLFAQMQALYAAWFIDCIPFGGIKPSSWQKTSIYTIADIIYGAPFSSKQFNTDGKGIPIIRIRDLKEQKVATYTTEKHPKGYLLQAGDIVVGMDGEFVPYIWGSDEAWLNQRVCVFKNKRLKGKAFLYFTIKPLLYAIEQTQVATTVIHIGKKDFDAFEITLPDPRVLDSFDAITTPMVEKIVENRFEIKQLELLRDAFLPKLMSGELDVSNIQL